MPAKILIIMMMLLSTMGCASIRENYSTRYGLTTTENPDVGQTTADESYSVGGVGQQYIEEYDKKYHEKHVLKENPPGAPEEESRQEEAP